MEMVVGGSAIRVSRHARIVYAKRPAADGWTHGKPSVARLDTKKHRKSGGPGYAHCAKWGLGTWGGVWTGDKKPFGKKR